MQQFVNQIRYSVRAERRGEPACSLLTNYDTVTPSLLVMPGQGEDTSGTLKSLLMHGKLTEK